MKLLKPKDKKLAGWQEKYARAKQQYSDQKAELDTYDAYYSGTPQVAADRNTRQAVTQKASNVRNIVYELIESQVDSNVPQPKVTAVHAEDEPLAKKIEDFLRNELDRLPFEELNDLNERVTPVAGGDFFGVYWDTGARTHTTIGAVDVSEINPRRITPQAGVTEIDEMDYLFVTSSRSKQSIQREFGKTVETVSESEPEVRGEGSTVTDDLVTMVTAYHRNSEGGIGKFSWVDDLVLEDYDDYQARRLERCVRCREIKTGDVCACGSKSWRSAAEEEELLTEDIQIAGGDVIQAFAVVDELVINPDGTPQVDLLGKPVVQPVERQTSIPYYKPDVYPIVLRRNVSMPGTFLGSSDVARIADQQETVKKLGHKINEKVLKGGSFVTLPPDGNIDTSDANFKIFRPKNPAEMGFINVFTVQPDISKDMTVLETNYQWAKSTLGITDSFQGKQDNTATSGTAKQFAAQQTAGRLESKRRMKNAAYAHLFELMFKFWLAYADEPRAVVREDSQGKEYYEISRYEFLKTDAAGELFWNDEFLFDVDSTGMSAANRGAMWGDAKANLQSGAFGDPTDLRTLVRYWGFMDEMHYPKAKEMKQMLEEAYQEQQAMLPPATPGGLAEPTGMAPAQPLPPEEVMI